MNKPSPPVVPGLAARAAALEALNAVMLGRRMLPEFVAGDALSAAEAATAQRLATGTLRHLSNLDKALGQSLRKTPKPQLRNILRLGAYELMIEREAPHAVVDACVRLAKADKGTLRGAGLVNAILRGIAELDAPEVASVPPLPPWMRKILNKAYGAEAVAAIEAAHLAGAPIDLTLKPGAEIEGTLLPSGSVRLAKGAQVSALPGYAEGAFWVQDAAAAIPARALGDVTGKAVLDLCAAPGGKTLQLAAAGAEVTALDISEPRLERLEQNLKRMGLAANLVCADALEWVGGPFDAVLLDAPCSATGTIRRHPELPHIRRPQEVETLTRLQMQLLDRALSWLKPGGHLLYCTCSLLPNEGENQVKAAQGRHDGLRIIPLSGADFGGDESWHSAEGGLRLRPDFWGALGGMDGFYIALLQHR